MDALQAPGLLRGIKPYGLRKLAYRMWISLANLASGCDAARVHSSTASHYAVVSELLNAGVHVRVDKTAGGKST